MRGSRIFVQGVPTVKGFFVFLVDDGREDPNTTISGPLSARQRKPFKWRFFWYAGHGPTLNAGLVAL